MFHMEIDRKKENDDHSKEVNLLFNALDEYVLVIEEGGTILGANKSALVLLDYTYDEIFGMGLSHLCLSKSADEIKEMIKNMLEGRISRCNMQLSTKTGVQIPIEACAFIGNWNGKTVIYAICKKLSEALEIKSLLKIANCYN